MPSVYYPLLTYWRTNNIEIENNELKKVSIKNRTCYYFGDVIKFEYFDFDNISLLQSRWIY